jgi:hypothetical protein
MYRHIMPTVQCVHLIPFESKYKCSGSISENQTSIRLASHLVRAYKQNSNKLDDVSSNPLCGHEPGTLVTLKTTYGLRYF